MNIPVTFSENTTSINAKFGEVSVVGGANSQDVTAAIEQHNADKTAHAELLKDYATAEAVAKAETAAQNHYSNAIKATASGEIVRVDDVSPFEHTAKAKVRGKNLLPYPYANISATQNGGTFTVQEDGGVLVSGTPTEYTSIGLYDGMPLADSGIVTFSLNGDFANVNGAVVIYDKNDKVLYNKETWGGGEPVTIDLDTYPSAARWLVYIKRGGNGAEMTGTLYPLIEYGDTATEYEPYIDPATVTVTKCGKNMLPNTGKSFTGNGITFTVNEDGSVTCNGTATKNAVINLTENYRLPLGTYILRGCPSTGSDTTHRLQTNKIINGEVSTGCVDVGSSARLNITQECQVYSYIVVLKDTTVSNVTFYPQLLPEAETDTQYEPYNGETYTPTADGTCNIVSVSPTMTLLTDTPGANIEVEYNQDSNAFKANVAADLQELDKATAALAVEMGDVETALDGIIAIQNELIGGDGV